MFEFFRDSSLPVIAGFWAVASSFTMVARTSVTVTRIASFLADLLEPFVMVACPSVKYKCFRVKHLNVGVI